MLTRRSIFAGVVSGEVAMVAGKMVARLIAAAT